ncbi:DUF421 domain-containing protein [Pontibacter sp. HSC-36F09]|uniref:DUF421 domain-containing protein n=1 Tax=Pontibacter sp. HSC-36F09 TaxID=2910966 RepID=UPI00209C92F0|nr:YetF domain-containing protein [Pontibacter sp. HSC-36F09]MCP2042315.1 uncharacterized membrane protein YcaP (DUF421 family) [Pontibacter sp. HSC-36F09]
MVNFLDTLLGIGSDSLTWWQMSIRAVVVFIAALLIMRVGNKRIFGKHTAFDIVLGIIYGSVLSRAITGNSPFWPTLAAALTLVLLHRFLAFLAYSTSGFLGPFIKGDPVCLIKDGKVQEDELKKLNLTENDLQEALRVGGVTDAKDVAYGCLERSGNISIVKKDS